MCTYYLNSRDFGYKMVLILTYLNGLLQFKEASASKNKLCSIVIMFTCSTSISTVYVCTKYLLRYVNYKCKCYILIKDGSTELFLGTNGLFASRM